MKSLSALAGSACLLLLAAAWSPGWGAGRSADDYMHGAAAKYIQGRLQEASVEVEEGLRQYPKEPRLKSLADQLKKMKDQKKQDQGGSGSQGGEDPKGKEDKKDSDGQGSKQKQDQDQKEKDKEKQKAEEEAKKEQEQKDKGGGKENQEDQAKEDKSKGDSSGQAAAPAKPGQMSKEEAERLLNSYQDDEKREHQQMQRRQRRPVDVEKDW